MGISSALEDLKRTMEQMHRLSFLSSVGNSHRHHRLFNHKFSNFTLQNGYTRNGLARKNVYGSN